MNKPFPSVEIEPLHMYCKTATITDSEGSVSAVVEDAPDGRLVIWELDFECSDVRRRTLLDILFKYLDEQGRQYTVLWGYHR
jgi:hypothetical protein